MKAHTIGKVLGAGLRIVGRAAGEKLTGDHPTPQQISQRRRGYGQAAGRASRGLVRGLGGFLAPFGRIGSILWLEVMGVMFLLPALVGVQFLWRTRASWQTGPDHRTFLSSLVIAVVFLYLSVTSFLRARRK